MNHFFYFSLTIHFVDKDWHRHDFPVGLAHFESNEAKNATNIGVKITEMLGKFKIETNRVIGMICDGAPVMPASARTIEIKKLYLKFECY